MSEMSKNSKQISPVKQALIEIRELRSRINLMEKAQNEPIAIVGAGLRFPGGAKDLKSFWQILQQGKDTISETPKDRWNMDDYYDPDPDATGKIYTKYGGYIKNVDKFDAELFRISADEAMPMDPQHRLLLEVTWSALEQAGQAPDKLRDSNTGVFVGISAMDNFIRLVSDEQSINPHYAIGNLYSAAAGRISYTLGLKGPSVALDTACSSSLVAVHNACHSLRNSECDMAIAGGVSLMLTPHLNINFSRARMIAKDGRCKTFDKDADGYIRGEGCGIIILKRLSEAIADNNNILALIKGSAVNHAGRSSGITAPNGPAQETVITNALKNANVNPGEVDYIEAHGTGTTLGDPIEVQALASVFGKSRGFENPLLIGTVKTNIGHLEAASGVAGVIKVILAMQKENIPRHINFNSPNPLIRWAEIPVKVTSEETSWEKNDKIRIAGVSSFGFSGTNAHIVLQEAPSIEHQLQDESKIPLHIFTISAQNNKALKMLAGKYESVLSEADDPKVQLRDICFSAGNGRAHLEERLAILTESKQQLVQKLAAWNSGDKASAVYETKPHDLDVSKVAFLFSGNICQWAQMGIELYDTVPSFKKIIDECDNIIQSFTEIPSISDLFKQREPDPDNSNEMQNRLAYFSFEYAQAQLWRSWGVEPAVVLGSSTGEIVAACIAGILSLQDSLKLAAKYKEDPINFLQPRLDIISSVSGQPAAKDMSRMEYWERPEQKTLNADDWVSALQKQHSSVFLEIGGKSLLAENIRQFKDQGLLYLTSLNPDMNQWSLLVENLAILYTNGVNVHWEDFYKDYNSRHIDLPLYPFQRQRYWIDTSESGTLSSRSEENKIDYKMMTIPNKKKGSASNFVAPRNNTEKRIADVWKDLLNVERISIHDSFFDLGGQSVQTMQISLEIERIFGKKLPLAALFPTPTIEKLAEALELDEQETPFHSLVPLQPQGSQTPIFGVHSTRYHTLSQYMGPDQPIYSLRYGHASENSEDILSLPENIEDLASSYISEMQMIQPHGPYNIIGLCIGALVAFEIANKLTEKGEHVGLLVLADPVIKGSKKSVPITSKITNLRQIGALKAMTRARKKLVRKFLLAKGKRSSKAQFKYSDYMPQKVYPGKAIIIKTVGNVSLSSIFDPELGWRELIAGGLAIHEIESSHTGVLEEPAVKNMAELLKKYLGELKKDQMTG